VLAWHPAPTKVSSTPFASSCPHGMPALPVPHARFEPTTISEWNVPVTSATAGFSSHVHDEWYCEKRTVPSNPEKTRAKHSSP
jgi:hypothetical protein